jgi:DNA-binding NarL/FixJ family response regulator
MKIKVTIVDDQPLVRDGIASLLSLQKELEVSCTFSNGREAIEGLMKNPTDVVLMDIRMPGMDGITVTEKLITGGFTGRILMLTTFDDEEYIVKALRAGAVGYLLKDIPIEDLTRAVIQAHQGIWQLSGGIMACLVGKLTTMQEKSELLEPETRRQIESMNERERDILRLIGEGLTNREIGIQLNLSEGTIKNYVSEILLTLGLRDRMQAAIIAWRLNKA